MKTRQQKLKLIADAYARLEVLNNQTWTNYRDVVCKQALEEERQHRGSDFNRFHPHAVSAIDCARMFTVHRIAQYLAGDKPPEVKDFFHLQRSAYMAAALVCEFRGEITKAWAGLPMSELVALDYVEFVGEVVTPREVSA